MITSCIFLELQSIYGFSLEFYTYNDIRVLVAKICISMNADSFTVEYTGESKRTIHQLKVEYNHTTNQWHVLCQQCLYVV